MSKITKLKCLGNYSPHRNNVCSAFVIYHVNALDVIDLVFIVHFHAPLNVLYLYSNIFKLNTKKFVIFGSKLKIL